MAGFGTIASRLYGAFTRNSRTVNSIVDYADPGPGDRVLDVGCGAGSGVAHAASRLGAENVAAIDPSATFVDQVRKRVPGADVREAGAEDVPFEEQTFSLVWSVASMHHWDDRERGLSALVRVLSPGGRLLIAERTLKRPGHGITPDQSDTVMSFLRRLGQTDVTAVDHRVGRRQLTIIDSSRPGESQSPPND